MDSLTSLQSIMFGYLGVIYGFGVFLLRMFNNVENKEDIGSQWILSDIQEGADEATHSVLPSKMRSPYIFMNKAPMTLLTGVCGRE